MKALRLIGLLALAAFILYVKLSTAGSGGATAPQTTPAASPSSPNAAPTAAVASPTDGAVPDKAVHVLQIVRQTGQPPDGYVGGRVFENRENRLPAGGDYREFDVDPHNGQRNAERLIVEWNTKKAWYTGDHYQTFTPVP
jgi:ribonuclease T1